MPVSMHYVCTYNEARDLIDRQERFWVANCGCREKTGGCSRSRLDLCISFKPEAASGGSGHRKINRKRAGDILEEARQNRLVPRPYRGIEDAVVEGICFCCSCCCAYFLNQEEACDKGRLVEHTSMGECTHCGNCVEACLFQARSMTDQKLAVKRKLCYGCGICVEVCPAACITMVDR